MPTPCCSSSAGAKRHAFRPPNGRVTPSILAFSLWRRRPLVLWTVDSLDYTLSAARRGEPTRGQAPPIAGDVILFHDDGGCAGDALEVLLPAWKKAGLHFPVLA